MVITSIGSDFARNHAAQSLSLRPFRLFLALAVFFVGCTNAISDKDETADAGADEVPAGPPPALVRVQSVKGELIAPVLQAVGTVRPIQVSVIASAADGVVDEFNEEVGRFVKAGTVLSRLRMKSTNLALDEERAILKARESEVQQVLEPRKEDIEEAVAQEMAAAAALANAERRLKELTSLAVRGAANQSSVDDAQLLYDEVKQKMLAAQAVSRRVSAGARDEEKLRAKAQLEAQKKHVDWLEAESEKRITFAPFDGFIVQKQTYLGQWLSKGDPVVTMAQFDEVEVEVLVDQSFVAQVNIGDKVRLKVNGTPNLTAEDGYWTGSVHSIVPRSDWQSGSRSFPVILRVENKMGGTEALPIPALREGMMVEAEFFGTSMDALLVPKDALVRTSRGTFVFAVNERTADADPGVPDSVRQVLIETGISKEGWIQAMGSDLKVGERVITEGAERLRPFQSISIMAEPAAETPAETPAQ